MYILARNTLPSSLLSPFFPWLYFIYFLSQFLFSLVPCLLLSISTLFPTFHLLLVWTRSFVSSASNTYTLGVCSHSFIFHLLNMVTCTFHRPSTLSTLHNSARALLAILLPSVSWPAPHHQHPFFHLSFDQISLPALGSRYLFFLSSIQYIYACFLLGMKSACVYKYSFSPACCNISSPSLFLSLSCPTAPPNRHIYSISSSFLPALPQYFLTSADNRSPPSLYPGTSCILRLLM